jgi:uncharacterized membrane protein YphA (DoxX/SURF4 family)
VSRALLERATATKASVWAIFVRLAVGLVFLPEGIQKLVFPEILGSGRFARIGISAPELWARSSASSTSSAVC